MSIESFGVAQEAFQGLEFSNYLLNDRARKGRSWCQLSIGRPEIKAIYGQADLFLEKLKGFYE